MASNKGLIVIQVVVTALHQMADAVLDHLFVRHEAPALCLAPSCVGALRLCYTPISPSLNPTKQRRAWPGRDRSV